MSEAEAAIEGIVALTTACARARLASDEAHLVKSRRKAALDFIDAHLGKPQLGPDEIADAAHLIRVRHSTGSSRQKGALAWCC